MMRFLLTGIVIGALVVLPARAAERECLVPYEAFKQQVKHFDLEECPEQEIGADDGFCRLELDGGKAIIHVFEFLNSDEACLTEARIMPLPVFLRRYAD